jgi:hypothetical protein
MKLFEKLKAKSCYRTSPVEHIYQSFVTENPYYDDLYENQNRQQHETWINFRNELQMPCKFMEDLQQVNMDVEILCLWFFRERSDRDKGADISIGNIDEKKIITYKANTLFMIDTKHNIKIKKRERFFPRRPCLQIEMQKDKYQMIKKGMGINE